MKTDLFQSCGHCWVFQIYWHIECSTFTASSFRIWNSSTGIPLSPLALFILMLRKAHLLLNKIFITYLGLLNFLLAFTIGFVSFTLYPLILPVWQSFNLFYFLPPYFPFIYSFDFLYFIIYITFRYYSFTRIFSFDLASSLGLRSLFSSRLQRMS